MSTLIFESLAAVMLGLDAIGKNKKNQQQGFQYRGIDDAYNALHPLFKEHGVVSAPEVLSVSREERQTKNGGNLIYSVATIKYTFYAKDGSNISCVVAGEGMDSGDKSMNKAMAVAHKYALMQLFCIPTEDMPDPDKESHQVAKAKKAVANTDKPEGLATSGQIQRIQILLREIGLVEREDRINRINNWLNRRGEPEVASSTELLTQQASALIKALEKQASAPVGQDPFPPEQQSIQQ